MLSCLGGWCHLRDKCRHHITADRSQPVERLCEPKTQDAFEPVRRVVPIRREEVTA